MVMVVVLAMPVRPVLRIEGRLERAHARTQAAQHVFEHVVAPDSQPVAHHLHVGMAIADVPGEPGQIVRRCRSDFDQRLRLAGDAHHGAVLEHEAIAVAQGGRMRQIKQERRAALAGQGHAPAMAIVGIEHDAVDGARRVPGAGRSHR